MPQAVQTGCRSAVRKASSRSAAGPALQSARTRTSRRWQAASDQAMTVTGTTSSTSTSGSSSGPSACAADVHEQERMAQAIFVLGPAWRRPAYGGRLRRRPWGRAAPSGPGWLGPAALVSLGGAVSWRLRPFGRALGVCSARFWAIEEGVGRLAAHISLQNDRSPRQRVTTWVPEHPFGDSLLAGRGELSRNRGSALPFSCLWRRLVSV